MPKDRDQMTPVDPEDLARLERHRGQGTAGTGEDLLPGEPDGPPAGVRLELQSPAFDDGAPLPGRFAHDSENVSPPLDWFDVPANAAELALICEDPDAPAGTFTHWVVAGIDPRTTHLDEGAVPPSAIAGRNDFGELGWGGPEPPVGHGPHRYVFTLVASAEPLDLDVGTSAAAVRAAAAGHELAWGELVGTYERPA
jgi:Raf kinase inhibitor-like YbhB/YbcL family protein